jgi:membrane-associated phospholipid phosphatase
MGGWLESLVPWGTEVIVYAQSLSNEWLDSVFGFLTTLGYEEFYLVVLPFVYWCLNKRIGTGLAFISLFSAWLNSAVKYIFTIPRPDDPRIIPKAPRPETSPSFPSGHAQNAVVNWGYLATHFRSWIFRAIAFILVVGIGLSRIVLGVHYPQDVIAGWLMGLLLLALYVWLEKPVGHWLAAQPLALQLALAVLLPLLLILLHPADAEGFPAAAAIVPMGAMTGLGVGIIMERRLVGFQVRGAWWRRGLRMILGFLVVAVLYAGSNQLVPDGLSYDLEAALRFLRYAILGLTMAFLCPWFFVRLHLAEQEAETRPVG